MAEATVREHDASVETGRTVLLVECSEKVRDRVGGWLEREGWEVLTCPGPTGPDYRCVAARGHTCPLVPAADVVILDLWLESDRAVRGTSSRRLLQFYASSGLPVVALTYRPHEDSFPLEGSIAEVAWPPDRRELVETVRGLLS
jgi:DNA-binding response OmpR family regulator